MLRRGTISLFVILDVSTVPRAVAEELGDALPLASQGRTADGL